VTESTDAEEVKVRQQGRRVGFVRVPLVEESPEELREDREIADAHAARLEVLEKGDGGGCGVGGTHRGDRGFRFGRVCTCCGSHAGRLPVRDEPLTESTAVEEVEDPAGEVVPGVLREAGLAEEVIEHREAARIRGVGAHWPTRVVADGSGGKGGHRRRVHLSSDRDRLLMLAICLAKKGAQKLELRLAYAAGL
jgi:hypothetical protein